MASDDDDDDWNRDLNVTVKSTLPSLASVPAASPTVAAPLKRETRAAPDDLDDVLDSADDELNFSGNLKQSVLASDAAVVDKKPLVVS